MQGKCRNILIIQLILISVVCVSDICFGQQKPDRIPVVGISVIGTKHNWDINAYLGARERAQKLGMKVIAYDGERVPEKQIADVKKLIKAQVDVIAVILGDSESLTPVLKEAADAGVSVVSADFVNPYSLCNVSTDNISAMEELVEHMAEDLNYRGSLAVFYTPGIPIAELRYKVFTRILSKYPEMHVAVKEDWKFPKVTEDAYKKTLKILSTHPEIDAFWSIFDMPMIGAARAIAELKKEDHVKVYGFDGDPTAMKMIMDKQSAYTATVAQQPYKIGEQLAEVAKMAAEGKPLKQHVFIEHIFVNKANAGKIYATLPQYRFKKFMLRSDAE